MKFSERLKAERLKKGFKQRELAEKIKSTNTSVSNWEGGTSQPSASVIMLLAEALGISPFDLLGRYTVRDIQNLDKKNSSELSFEDSMALMFSADILKEANVNLEDVLVVSDEILEREIKELGKAVQNIRWDILLEDGGKQLLYAYNSLNSGGKTLLLEYMTGLLRVPVYLDEMEPNVNEQQIEEITIIKENLKRGSEYGKHS